MHYAHRTEESAKNNWQLLSTHLTEVSQLTGNFADHFRAREWGELAGLLHDIGKFSAAFQKRLAGASIRVDHATAGAQYITSQWPHASAKLLAYVIAGHHAGLADHGTESGGEACLARRLKKDIEPFTEFTGSSIPAHVKYPKNIPLQTGNHPALQLSLFTRMLFSCLVDADSLDSEKFADPIQAAKRSPSVAFSSLMDGFTSFMHGGLVSSQSPLNKARNELLHECLEKAKGKQGLYTLTLPTGSGKTLTSLGFALSHAIQHNLRRIIYVIPYTSIIEQNAAIFRQVLGDEHVLEHHSNVQHDRDLPDAEEIHRELKQKLLLAEENWDYPVVVTTNVQFFESLYSNKRSRCRKLHNVSNSVIILDEAQMMNGEFFKPSMYALEELTRNYGSTVVLSTATQPNVEALFPKPIELLPMVDDVLKWFEQFRRVRLELMGKTDYYNLADKLAVNKQGLCIVNTRRAAREIYEKVKARLGEEGVYHLSARMYPAHRMEQLKIIRDRLEKEMPCVLISTQLVECGVDVDFPTVYRELAGLDSMAQAAGRCNRNGRLPIATTYIFETESTPDKGWFGMTAGAARYILQTYEQDPLSLEAIQAYFHRLYAYQTLGSGSATNALDMTDKHAILAQLAERPAQRYEFPFQTIADQFNLIDTATKPVIIPSAQAERHLESLLHATTINGVMRDLQPYVVQLYPQEFEAFRRAGEIEEVRVNVFKLTNPDRWYDMHIGVIPFSEEHHANEVYCV